MPAGAYNGDRFESRRIPYPSILKDLADFGPDIPTIISDVPRLNIGPGMSRIQLMTRDLATPAIGFHVPSSGLGLWLLTGQGMRLGDSGLEIEEYEDRSRAMISIFCPQRAREHPLHNCRYTVSE